MESERNTDKPKTYQSLSSVAYKFGWVLGCGSDLREEILVAAACNHPNGLVIPFRTVLIRLAA
jgi:hypothetical protein